MPRAPLEDDRPAPGPPAPPGSAITINTGPAGERTGFSVRDSRGTVIYQHNGAFELENQTGEITVTERRGDGDNQERIERRFSPNGTRTETRYNAAGLRTEQSRTERREGQPEQTLRTVYTYTGQEGQLASTPAAVRNIIAVTSDSSGAQVRAERFGSLAAMERGAATLTIERPAQSGDERRQVQTIRNVNDPANPRVVATIERATNMATGVRTVTERDPAHNFEQTARFDRDGRAMTLSQRQGNLELRYSLENGRVTAVSATRDGAAVILPAQEQTRLVTQANQSLEETRNNNGVRNFQTELRQSLLDTSNSSAERTQALAALQRIYDGSGPEAQTAIRPALQDLQTLSHVLALFRASGGGQPPASPDAQTAARELESLRARATGTPADEQAQRLLRALGGSDDSEARARADRLIADFRSTDESRRNEALTALRTALERPLNNELGRIRTNEVAATLRDHPSDADLQRARQELLRAGPGNPDAAALLGRVEVDIALRNLARLPAGAQGTQQLESIMRGLQDRSRNDPYALSALNAILTYGAGTEAVQAFNTAAGRDHTARIPDLSGVSAEQLARARTMAAEQLHSHAAFWGNRLSDSARETITSALARAQAAGEQELAQELEQALECSLTDSTRSGDIGDPAMANRSRERNPDNSLTTFDAQGRVARVDYPNGQSRTFERDAQGNITAIRESNGTTWTSTDGRSFRNTASGESVNGIPAIERDGTYRFTQEDGRTITRNTDNSTNLRDDRGSFTIYENGSQILRNQAGHITGTVSADGRAIRFEPGADGQPVRVRMPDGRIWERAENGTWRNAQSHAPMQGRWELNTTTGDLTLRSTANRQFITMRLDGSRIVADPQTGRIASIESRDGQITRPIFDPGGQLIGVRTPDGQLMRNIGPNQWLRDGSNEIFRGSITLDNDGNIRRQALDAQGQPVPGGLVVTHPDGWQEHRTASGAVTYERHGADGSHVIRNQAGQISEVTDAGGRTRRFTYDATTGRMSSVTYADGARWETQDGLHWTRPGTTQTWTGRISVSETGIISEFTNDGRNERRVNTDGSTAFYERGRLTELHTNNSQVFKYGYDERGVLNRIELPGQNGDVWRSEDGRHFRRFSSTGVDRNESAEFTRNADGSLEQRTTVNGRAQTWTYRPDGSLRDSATGLTESPQTDGTRVFTNERGQVVRVVDRSNRTTEYGYDPQTHMLNRFTTGGVTYTTADGMRWTSGGAGHPPEFMGRVAVLPDGTRMQTNLNTGVETLYRNDGTRMERQGVTFRVYDSHDQRSGRITETVDANGVHRYYRYGNVTHATVRGDAQGNPVYHNVTIENQLTGFRVGNGPWLTTDNSIDWRNEQGQVAFTGSVLLHRDGHLQQIDANFRETNHYLDGTSPTRGREDLQSTTLQILNILTNGSGDFNGNAAAVDALLRNRPAGEVLMIARLAETTWAQQRGFQTSFQNIVLNGLKDRRGVTDAPAMQRVLTHLERGDQANFEAVQADNAGRIAVAIRGGNGLSDADRERMIRTTLVTLTRAQIDDTRRAYDLRWGAGRFDQDLGNMQMSAFTRQAANLYLQGSDRITSQQRADLMTAAANAGLEHLEETAAHSNQADRDLFVRAQGGYDNTMSTIWARYGHWYGAGDARHARDAILYGETQVDTRLADAGGIFSNDQRLIEQTLRNMSQEDRERFYRGMHLYNHQDEIRTAEDQRAAQLYRNTVATMCDLHTWNTVARALALVDQVRVEGGGLVTELTALNGRSRHEQIAAVQNMTQSTWNALSSDPNYRDQVSNQLRSLVGDNHGAIMDLIDRRLEFSRRLDGMDATQLHTVDHFANLSQDDLQRYLTGRAVARELAAGANGGRDIATLSRLERELAERARTDPQARARYEALQFYRNETFAAVRDGIRRDIISAIGDAATITHPTNGNSARNEQARAIIDALVHMTADERTRARGSTQFRTDLERRLAETLGRDSGAYTAAMSLLGQLDATAAGRTPPPPRLDAIAQLNMLSYERTADGRSNTGRIAEIIAQGLRDDPTLAQRLASTEFRDAVRRAATISFDVPGMNPQQREAAVRAHQDAVERLIRPIVEAGSITGDAIAALGRARGVTQQDLLAIIRGMSPQALSAIQGDSRQREAALGSITNAHHRQVVATILSHAQDLVRDRRAFVQALPANHREAAERIFRQGGAREAGEQALLRQLTKDQLSTLNQLLQGPVHTADVMRLFVTRGGATSAEVTQALSRLSFGQRREVAAEYARSYGTADMRSDLVARAERAEREQMEYLCRSEALSADLRTQIATDGVIRSDTFASGLMDICGYGGARRHMLADLNQMRAEVGQAHLAGRPVDEARFDRLEQAFRDALVGFRESKEAFANACVNVAIIAGSTLATGGLSLGPILAAAAAGATLRVGANMLIQGADFEYTSRNVLGHLASGSVEGAFSVAAPGLLARIPGLSRAVGGSAARTVATRLGLEAESAAGRAVAAEVERAVAGALINRAAGVAEGEVAAIAARLAQQGYHNITRELLTDAIKQAIRQESASLVRVAAMEFLHAAGNTATGMGSGALGSLVDQGITRDHIDMHEVWTATWQGGLSGLAMTGVGRGLHYGPGRRIEHGVEHLQEQARAYAQQGLTRLASDARFNAAVLQYGWGMLHAAASGYGGDLVAGAAGQHLTEGHVNFEHIFGRAGESGLHMGLGIGGGTGGQHGAGRLRSLIGERHGTPRPHLTPQERSGEFTRLEEQRRGYQSQRDAILRDHATAPDRQQRLTALDAQLQTNLQREFALRQSELQEIAGPMSRTISAHQQRSMELVADLVSQGIVHLDQHGRPQLDQQGRLQLSVGESALTQGQRQALHQLEQLRADMRTIASLAQNPEIAQRLQTIQNELNALAALFVRTESPEVRPAQQPARLAAGEARLPGEGGQPLPAPQHNPEIHLPAGQVRLPMHPSEAGAAGSVLHTDRAVPVIHRGAGGQHERGFAIATADGGARFIRIPETPLDLAMAPSHDFQRQPGRHIPLHEGGSASYFYDSQTHQVLRVDRQTNQARVLDAQVSNLSRTELNQLNPATRMVHTLQFQAGGQTVEASNGRRVIRIGSNEHSDLRLDTAGIPNGERGVHACVWGDNRGFFVQATGPQPVEVVHRDGRITTLRNGDAHALAEGDRLRIHGQEVNLRPSQRLDFAVMPMRASASESTGGGRMLDMSTQHTAERIEPGTRYGESAHGVPPREINTNIDPVMAAVERDALARFDHLRNNPRELMRQLTEYVHDLTTPHRNRQGAGGQQEAQQGPGMNRVSRNLDAALQGRQILLGELIARGNAVCLDQSMLLGYLAQRLGVDAQVATGTLAGTPHAWVQMRAGEQTLIFDPRNFNTLRHSERSGMTPREAGDYHVYGPSNPRPAGRTLAGETPVPRPLNVISSDARTALTEISTTQPARYHQLEEAKTRVTALVVSGSVIDAPAFTAAVEALIRAHPERTQAIQQALERYNSANERGRAGALRGLLSRIDAVVGEWGQMHAAVSGSEVITPEQMVQHLELARVNTSDPATRQRIETLQNELRNRAALDAQILAADTARNRLSTSNEPRGELYRRVIRLGAGENSVRPEELTAFIQHNMAGPRQAIEQILTLDRENHGRLLTEQQREFLQQRARAIEWSVNQTPQIHDGSPQHILGLPSAYGDTTQSRVEARLARAREAQQPWVANLQFRPETRSELLAALASAVTVPAEAGARPVFHDLTLAESGQHNHLRANLRYALENGHLRAEVETLARTLLENGRLTAEQVRALRSEIVSDRGMFRPDLIEQHRVQNRFRTVELPQDPVIPEGASQQERRRLTDEHQQQRRAAQDAIIADLVRGLPPEQQRAVREYFEGSSNRSGKTAGIGLIRGSNGNVLIVTFEPPHRENAAKAFFQEITPDGRRTGPRWHVLYDTAQRGNVVQIKAEVDIPALRTLNDLLPRDNQPFHLDSQAHPDLVQQLRQYARDAAPPSAVQPLVDRLLRGEQLSGAQVTQLRAAIESERQKIIYYENGIRPEVLVRLDTAMPGADRPGAFRLEENNPVHSQLRAELEAAVRDHLFGQGSEVDAFSRRLLAGEQLTHSEVLRFREAMTLQQKRDFALAMLDTAMPRDHSSFRLSADNNPEHQTLRNLLQRGLDNHQFTPAVAAHVERLLSGGELTAAQVQELRNSFTASVRHTAAQYQLTIAQARQTLESFNRALGPGSGFDDFRQLLVFLRRTLRSSGHGPGLTPVHAEPFVGPDGRTPADRRRADGPPESPPARERPPERPVERTGTGESGHGHRAVQPGPVRAEHQQEGHALPVHPLDRTQAPAAARPRQADGRQPTASHPALDRLIAHAESPQHAQEILDVASSFRGGNHEQLMRLLESARPEQLAALARIFHDREAQVRDFGSELLREIEDPAARAAMLEAVLTHRRADRLLETFHLVTDTETFQALAQMPANQRSTLLDALSSFGDTQSRADFVTRLGNMSETERNGILSALASFNQPEARTAALNYLTSHQEFPALLRHLAELPLQQARLAMLSGLADPNSRNAVLSEAHRAIVAANLDQLPTNARTAMLQTVAAMNESAARSAMQAIRLAGDSTQRQRLLTEIAALGRAERAAVLNALADSANNPGAEDRTRRAGALMSLAPSLLPDMLHAIAQSSPEERPRIIASLADLSSHPGSQRNPILEGLADPTRRAQFLDLLSCQEARNYLAQMARSNLTLDDALAVRALPSSERAAIENLMAHPELLQTIRGAIMNDARRFRTFDRLGLTEQALNFGLQIFSGQYLGVFRSESARVELSSHTRAHTQVFVHELTHFLRSVDRTALYNADPEAYRRRVFDSVAARVGTGTARLATDPQTGRSGLTDRANLSLSGRERMRQALREALETGQSPDAVLAHSRYQELLAEQAFHGQRELAVRELALEVSHYNRALNSELIAGTSQLGGYRNLGNQALSDLIAARQAHYERVRRERGSLYDNPQLVRLTNGSSDNFTGQRDLDIYYHASREESAARRAEQAQALREIAREVRRLISDPAARRERIRELGWSALALIQLENIRERLMSARDRQLARGPRTLTGDTPPPQYSHPAWDPDR
jgi:YD repeat-containing protein